VLFSTGMHATFAEAADRLVVDVVVVE
jgi:hypothetical protein